METARHKGSIIVAVSENNVIGKENSLPWHLSADLKRFKSLTSGHSVIMGRKTYESIGKPLPNRRNIIVTRNIHYSIPSAFVVHSIEEAIKLSEDDIEPFFIGGEAIFQSALQYADKIYLTLVQTKIEGDVYFDPISPDIWQETGREDYLADAKNQFDYSFINYQRKEID